MKEKLKEVIWITKKIFQEALNKNLSLETRNLVVDKNKDVLTKEDRSTKRNFKNFVQSQLTKEQQTNIT